MTNVFKFVLGLDSIEGTYIEKRIARVFERDSVKTGSLYKVKEKIDPYSWFTKEQIDFVHKETREICIQLGLVKDSELNPFGVVQKFSDLTEEETKQIINYQKVNEKYLKARVVEREAGTLFKEKVFPESQYIDPEVMSFDPHAVVSSLYHLIELDD